MKLKSQENEVKNEHTVGICPGPLANSSWYPNICMLNWGTTEIKQPDHNL